MQQFKNNIKILLFIIILTGIIYPGLIAVITLIINNNLSDNKMFDGPIENPKYFFARPAAESASQIDPHINISMAMNQAKRIAKIRKLKQSDIIELINKYTEQPQLGFLGETRISVLKLNQALDFTFKRDQ